MTDDLSQKNAADSKPNVIVVFGDQWRQQATGFAGNDQVKTPRLDGLARESIEMVNAVSGCPVCTPARASMMTGQKPLTHGLFVNDVRLRPNGTTIAEAFALGGYDTACIGKWHLDGTGRSSYIPRERRLGFDYWKVLECSHDYNESFYYEGDSEEKKQWEGYDALSQTRDAQRLLQERKGADKPLFMMLSWGPPHSPYETAPSAFREMYDCKQIALRPNVPSKCDAAAREMIAGYYAHCSALDQCVGELLDTVDQADQQRDTVFVFTSDHGDMLDSQGHRNKQRPWDESIRVPWLLRFPSADLQATQLTAPINTCDLMPTLLGLCDLPIPDSVEGLDFSGYLLNGEPDPSHGMTWLSCPHPFGQWTRSQCNGKEYRGVRTERYTYVIDREAPWLLYDNEVDPYQLNNLIGQPEAADIQAQLDAALKAQLARDGDGFEPGMNYVERWGYQVDEHGTVPYTN